MALFEKTTSGLKELSALQKVIIVLFADLVLLNCVVLLAYMLRLSSFELPPPDKRHIYFSVPFISVASAFAFGVYEAAARNYSEIIERKLLASQTIATLVWALFVLFVGTTGFARSTVVIYAFLAILGMIVLRRSASHIFNVKSSGRPLTAKTPVVIYGAGREGIVLAEALRRSGAYKPVAFIDNDYTLEGRLVSDLRVYPIDGLEKLMDKFSPVEAIVANPNISRANRRVLVDKLMDEGLSVKIAPGLDQIIDGDVKVGDIRPIRLEDLLGRDPVPPDVSLMQKAIKDQVVMVTGAGGSIGSELVRQAAKLRPKTIVLYENNEFALFEIHREIEGQLDKLGTMTIVAVLADVQDKDRFASVLRDHAVDVVFHAAAYKHVRMVQENPTAGIFNNITGTKVAAEASLENGVKRFILVSTDKAVRPTSAMGATKRIAEMTLQALAAKPKQKTIFSMVRFGNVLGSTGSVVPLFREQIANGGPVKVTDPEVTRYFMLIPEAAQLVIQAGAMADGGEVFVLDMGESVKIVQLAETMIELAGLKRKTPETPDGDIEIIFSGLKPGEKLYEELQIGNDVTSTSHPRIMRSKETFLPLPELQKRLQTIERATQSEPDDKIVALLMKTAGLG